MVLTDAEAVRLVDLEKNSPRTPAELEEKRRLKNKRKEPAVPVVPVAPVVKAKPVFPVKPGKGKK